MPQDRLITSEEADALTPSDIEVYRVVSIREHDSATEEILYGIFFDDEEARQRAEEVQMHRPVSIVKQVFVYAYLDDVEDYESLA